MSVIRPSSATDRPPRAAVHDARVAGWCYLGLAVTGLVGYPLLQPGTSVDVLLELGIAATQALAAMAFFRLFAQVNAFRAGALAAFGLINAVVILTSAAALAAALGVAGDPSAVALLRSLSEALWIVGGLFFGLWLVPMGLLVLESGWMPRPLGWLLVVSGAGYVASTAVQVAMPEAFAVADLLTMPAAVGELWMIGYLLVRGVAPRRSEDFHANLAKVV
jgi:hypothetical protein